ncbi:hypothetical protein [Truepera radiovictrix]|uniref:Uncharacterized protein n=1 Tax=Truepera radiovictrix (strain DSM 17093 / CIP 108686 / LMG 22925 / RQ-24) TaxID=649638 RepID=D7CVX0_TRURR|nr:hypothetical protein [Truepera radiovictrix]ADI14233.1 hypothetical protein Trad_1106 [Truepera radiovictrix DSM 17093]WMT57210.1 hypothetical protein RCV51_14475 [Truepera radiovictrix]
MTSAFIGLVLHLAMCHALGDLSLLGEGTQVQLALPNLTKVLDTAVIEDYRLQLEAELEPLASVVLLISTGGAADISGGEAQVVTLSGFVSAAGDDIMVRNNGDLVSLRSWLRTMQDVTFTLRR